jgi:tryptophan synthase alpha chain
MSRLATRFEQLNPNNVKRLYLMSWRAIHSHKVTVSLLHKMVDAGVDVIELGLPFSDPMADGPVALRLNARCGGTNTLDALNMVKEFRQKDQKHL